MSTDRPANTIADLLAAARARLERLEPAAARDAVASGSVIVDTRCAEARQASVVIPGSVHVPLSVLYWCLDPTSGHDDPSISDPRRQVILVPHSSALAVCRIDKGRKIPFDGSKKRRGPCKAIVSPIDRTTLAAVEMDEAAVDG